MNKQPSIKIKHPGRLHQYLGIPKEKEIPETKLMDLIHGQHPVHVKKMARFALNARRFSH